MLENGSLVTLNMRDILPNRFQPRIYFDELKLNELAESIRKYGVIQPIVVRQIGNKYEIIAGERRYKASVLANRETIPAIITNLNDKEAEEIALLENIQRQNLTAIEEAVSYKRILSMGYITQEDLAKKVGKSQSTIANKVRLLNLDDQVQDALLHGKISERHARSLLRLHNKDDQVKMLSRIVNERLTVKRTDEEINKMLTAAVQKNIPKVETETLSISENRPAAPVSSHEINKNVTNERGKGFMDIDKILNEAEDINQSAQPTQAAPNLMQPNPNTVMSAPIVSAPEVEPQVQASASNKFVNFEGVNGPAQPVENTQPSQPQPTVTFDNLFQQTPVNNTTPVQPTPNFSPVSEPMPQPMANFAPTIEPGPQPMPSVNQQAMPFNPINDQTTAQPVPMNNVAQSDVVAPAAPVNTNMNIPSSDIIEESNMPSMATTDVKTVQPSNDAHRLMQAINLIRNCSKEIENLGFYVDVDEINLDDFYQVTFKINKD